ncbi:efflux RND transporter periplasmic adaptor subunit [Marinicella sp. S1101]|uniref:efflux RND transporter periplasmic adaptor subunit n=1 Tax=Marinicella marina TaxID=2996016 RepID=UPI002260FD2A|nr:efflux RND transporter periplasmic adaptor subunit [Marinicella marina]MCX7552838.1 efflux RND transporter periplasmic adaptor subunit [Marinicella marina]MDJ1139853.1 efflux RND transporter periplasmic adaptor subunit [Marinicella marina]
MKALKIIGMVWVLLSSGLSTAQNNSDNLVPVITASAGLEDFANVVEALGTLKANDSISITPTVTELVTEVHFSDGQTVEKGDLLISMDTSDEDALLQEEQARLGEAKRQVKRLQPLAAQNATSKSALDNQKSIVSVSEARIKGIQSQIDKRRITAPFDGVMGLLDISVGTLAQPGTVLATLDDTQIMKMDFSVPERHLAALQKGIKIDASTQAYPDREFIGEIAHIDSRINPNTRSVQVRAIVPNDDDLLKPGQLMRIKLLTQPRQSLLIPEEAVTSAGTTQTVFVVDHTNGKSIVRQTPIKPGNRYNGKIEVLSGISAGDEVIIHGTLRIQNGSAVEVIAQKKGNETLSELLAQRSNRTEKDT